MTGTTSTQTHRTGQLAAHLPDAHQLQQLQCHGHAGQHSGRQCGHDLMTLIAPAGGGDAESDIDALTWTTAGNGLYAAA